LSRPFRTTLVWWSDIPLTFRACFHLTAWTLQQIAPHVVAFWTGCTMHDFLPPAVMFAGGRCVWSTSAVVFDMSVRVGPPKSFLASLFLLSRRFCCCSLLFCPLLLLLLPNLGLSFSLLLLLLPNPRISFPLLALLLLKLCLPLPLRLFSLSSFMSFFSRLDPGLNDSDRSIVAEICSIDLLFSLSHGTFLLLQLGSVQGQAPLLQILFNPPLLRLSIVVRLCLVALFYLLGERRKKPCSPAVLSSFDSFFGSCDVSQVFDVLLQSPDRSLQLEYRRLESRSLCPPLGPTFFFLLSKCGDLSDILVCF
jgi:hypothetical protein